MKYTGYRIHESKQFDGQYTLEMLVLKKNYRWQKEGYWPFRKEVLIEGEEYEDSVFIYDNGDRYFMKYPSVEAAERAVNLIINPKNSIVKEVRFDRPETPD